MNYRIKQNLEFEPCEEKEAPRKGAQNVSGSRDPFGFAAIRKRVWGEGAPVKGSRDPFDFKGIMKALWGK